MRFYTLTPKMKFLDPPLDIDTTFQISLISFLIYLVCTQYRILYLFYNKTKILVLSHWIWTIHILTKIKLINGPDSQWPSMLHESFTREHFSSFLLCWSRYFKWRVIVMRIACKSWISSAPRAMVDDGSSVISRSPGFPRVVSF